MGRRSRGRRLGIWANGVYVGDWSLPAYGPMELRYAESWMASPAGRPLSLSLPFGDAGTVLKGDPVQHYFDNLLPDSDAIRRRVAARFAAASAEAFDLLAAIGRDCVGAVQLLPDGETPEGVMTIDGRPLSDDEVAQHLLRVAAPPGQARWNDEDDLRISLAGAQEKTALLRHQGRWCLPHGATPTTHIFKLPLGLVGNRKLDFSASLENEWLCARILAAYGLPVANCEILAFGAVKALAVERFDRQLHSSGRWWMRLPQEDFCQATDTPSHLKYENQGGPGMLEIARILGHSTQAEKDQADFFAAQVLFWMLAATDGHAKNFSLHIHPQGRYSMTPLYDVLSIWPVEGDGGGQVSRFEAKLAMAFRGRHKHYGLREIRRGHMIHTAGLMGLRAPDALIARIVERTPAVIAAVGAELPAGFPQRVADAMLGGLQRQASALAAMADGGDGG
ncbi:type II toxin-antitoxin system HipA family toxin [Pigmentiphaga soli]|uniref:Type II toxin-antitoxin system HipA family toxin n=1 Tax=Pigmentiphaga soli TaxID=1007095 RepID=A0ABP8GHN5_9BURK